MKKPQALVIAVGWPRTPAIVDAFGASATVAPLAYTYLHISLLGAPGMLIVLAGTGVLRGMQDTRTPLYVSVGMFTVNGLLGALFVLGFGWGIAGSDRGTVLGPTGGGNLFLV